MTCPDEGMWQSWLDRELPSADSRSSTAHLATCAACSSKVEQLRSRGAEVAAMLDTLSEASTQPAALYLPGPARWRWPATAATGFLVASLLLFAVLGRPPLAKRPAPRQSYTFPPPGFLALSDEPMQAGMVVQVSVPAAMVSYTGAVNSSGMVEAEVIVGEDGRPRAVRFLPQKAK